jgi:hypothetical protein
MMPRPASHTRPFARPPRPGRRVTLAVPTPPTRENTVLNAIIRRRVTALFVGALGLVIGIVMLSTSDVKCGSKKMSRGDICETTRNGTKTRATYDEQKLTDQRTGYAAVGVGALALLIGGVGFVMTGRQNSPR